MAAIFFCVDATIEHIIEDKNKKSFEASMLRRIF